MAEAGLKPSARALQRSGHLWSPRPPSRGTGSPLSPHRPDGAAFRVHGPGPQDTCAGGAVWPGKQAREPAGGLPGFPVPGSVSGEADCRGRQVPLAECCMRLDRGRPVPLAHSQCWPVPWPGPLGDCSPEPCPSRWVPSERDRRSWRGASQGPDAGWGGAHGWGFILSSLALH